MRIALLITFTAAAAFALACGNSTNSERTAAPPGRVVRDDLDRPVALPEKVTRAVSLAPNLTETIFAVGAGDRLVGVTSYCDFPADAKALPKVGDTLKPNIETIIALRPEVVFVSTASQLETFSKTLTERNIAVFVTNPNSLDGIYASIEKIGAVFDERSAAEVLAGFRRRVAEVETRTAATAKPKVLVQLDRSLFTIGRESFLTDIVRRAGGVSATGDLDKAYAQLNKETALALDPEVIVLSDSADNGAPADVLRNSKAVRTGRVYRINADIMSRPGPRVVEALEQMAAAFHPGLFKK
jgi:iron complex transport system substrate-binding protein